MITSLVSMLPSGWTLFAAFLIFLAYKWSTATFDYFAKKNVIYDQPIPFVGNQAMLMLQQESFFQLIQKLYIKYRKSKYFGMFQMRDPVLIINCPEIIKRITVKDFEYFLNHRKMIEPESEPIFQNLFNLQNQKWKDMRATLSPAFTGSKMRLMFQLIDECGQSVRQHLHTLTAKQEAVEVNMKDIFTRCTGDIIASCAFGLKIDSLSEKDNDFYTMAKKAMDFSGVIAVKMFFAMTFPKLVKLFDIKFFDRKFTQYFKSLVLDTIQNRQEKDIIRPDMIHLLMEARKGALHDQDVGKAEVNDGFATVQESTVGQKKVTWNWTDDEVVSQLFLFFIAGFESAAVLMSLCAHELMENPDTQEKLFTEIDQVREQLGGKPLSYEVLQKMKYLDMVISEALRKWPPAIVADRVCNKTYTIENEDGSQLTLHPGDVVAIPICGIHYDPDYFPNPTKFDPERFSDENKNNIKPFTYIPFGMGPRNCIGSRFALMEAKAILYYIVSEFKFEASAKSTIPMKMNGRGFQLQPKGGFWLKIRPRV